MSECLFCGLIKKKVNVLHETENIVIMLSPEPATPGHILVIPKQHAPIFEAVPDFVVAEMFKQANKMSVAAFSAIGAQGTNILIQNGPSAGQKHNHIMLHVIPRVQNDSLQLTWNPRQASDEELAKVEGVLKDETKSVGMFEKEKAKPIEEVKPKELKREDDYRIKHLRRIP